MNMRSHEYIIQAVSGPMDVCLSCLANVIVVIGKMGTENRRYSSGIVMLLIVEMGKDFCNN